MKQNGFTLIELIVVIVILGILSVVVAPKLIDLEGDAHQGVVDGIAGAAASGASMNFASCAAKGHDSEKCSGSGACITVNTCAAIEGLVPDVAWNVEYEISATAAGTEPDTNGARANCTVTDRVNGQTANFMGIGACIPTSTPTPTPTPG